MSFLQDLMTATRPSSNEAPVDRVAERRHSPLRVILQVVALWIRRRKDRAMLRSFSLRDIHDFCPRDMEAEAEMNKPFWRA